MDNAPDPQVLLAMVNDLGQQVAQAAVDRAGMKAAYEREIAQLRAALEAAATSPEGTDGA